MIPREKCWKEKVFSQCLTAFFHCMAHEHLNIGDNPLGRGICMLELDSENCSKQFSKSGGWKVSRAQDICLKAKRKYS